MGTVTKGHTFTPDSTIKSSEVNANFDTLYNDYNGNISNVNISSTAAILGTKLDLSEIGPIGSSVPSTAIFSQVNATLLTSSYISTTTAHVRVGFFTVQTAFTGTTNVVSAGFEPKAVQLNATVNNSESRSIGYDDLTSANCVLWNSSSNVFTSDTANSISLITDSGKFFKAKVSGWLANGFVVTSETSGAVAAATLNVFFIAYKL
jgi:hypothetical protein